MARQRSRVGRVTPHGRVRGGSVKVYARCCATAGGKTTCVSGYFSVRPGGTIEDLEREVERQLRTKLVEDSLPGGGSVDVSSVECSWQPSLGDLPEGSGAYEVLI